MSGNRLLRGLAASDLARLKPHIEHVELRQGEILFRADDSLTHVYFPHDAVISLQILVADGALVEAGTVGKEGVVGFGGLLARDVSFARQTVQLPGYAAKLSRKAFLAAVCERPSLRNLFRSHADAFASQLLQSVACRAMHSTEQRLARWLLTSLDRSGGDRINITHDDLAIAFGVRRPTVTLTIRSLEQSGIVDATRGTLTVTDRPGLERLACECYHIIKKNHERIFRQRRR